MPRSALTGTRIRERRLLLGVKQADLARSVDVSPAYLNLIEHNRRRVGNSLLQALAEALGVDEATLAEGAESALIDGLREAAAAGSAEAETGRIEEFVGRFPGWAALLAERQLRIDALDRVVETLSERIAHDPFLSASVHEVLSAVTSVRSTAAILAETEDIDPDWRARFHRNLHEDSKRLTGAAETLVAYLDGGGESAMGISTPQEEVDAWLGAIGHHIAPLERAHPPDAETLIARIPELASSAARSLAADIIARYRADALALPLEPFRQAVIAQGPDPARLATQFGTGLLPVFRRLAALPVGDGVPPIGLVICDGSGTLTYRKTVQGFSLPRFGAACPLWPLYQSLSRPMVPIRARVEVAERLSRPFLTYALCQPAHPQGFDGPQVIEAAMLILPETGAWPETGQGAGAGVQSVSTVPVGTSCRICPRGGCVARREPSILSEAS